MKDTKVISILYCTGVGRNKTFRAQARISVSGTRSRMPETPPRATLGWSYSGLRLFYL
ncbi:MAG: hypothetical protein QX196_13150 [Methylococcaceae bacterium]